MIFIYRKARKVRSKKRIFIQAIRGKWPTVTSSHLSASSAWSRQRSSVAEFESITWTGSRSSGSFHSRISNNMLSEETVGKISQSNVEFWRKKVEAFLATNPICSICHEPLHHYSRTGICRPCQLLRNMRNYYKRRQSAWTKFSAFSKIYSPEEASSCRHHSRRSARSRFLRSGRGQRFTSFFTAKTGYAKLVPKFKQTAVNVGIPEMIVDVIPNLKDWHLNTRQKAILIYQSLIEYHWKEKGCAGIRFCHKW